MTGRPAAENPGRRPVRKAPTAHADPWIEPYRPTAPCTTCRYPLLAGERRCPRCAAGEDWKVHP